MPEVLEAIDVSKRYSQGSPFIIRGFSHAFRPGTATGLTGPNGSGKTTMLRLLTTVAYPTSGQIRLGDLDIHKNPHQYLSKTGFSFDSTDLPEFANTQELLELILRTRNLWDDKSPEVIQDLLKLLGLDDRRTNLIGTYSSGMMQKALLASSLIAKPDIIILDEPFRALDQQTRTALTDYLMEQKKSGKTLILASHLPEIVEHLCDEIIEFPLETADVS